MKERPILFSAPMVRAILDGSKTQTRRVVKAKHLPWLENSLLNFLDGKWNQRPLPYGQPGDRLWVRETWQVARETLDYETGGEYDVWEWPDELGDPRQYLGGDARFGTKAGLFYAADGEDENPGVFYDLIGIDNKTILRPKEINWRPSIHMPRWASRITLEITGVRVERLQDISEADAIAEGIDRAPSMGKPGAFQWCDYRLPRDPSEWFNDPVRSYQSLWDLINGPGSWDANPWVWVVEFKCMEGATP